MLLLLLLLHNWERMLANSARLAPRLLGVILVCRRRGNLRMCFVHMPREEIASSEAQRTLFALVGTVARVGS